jgi:hypothetical protein
MFSLQVMICLDEDVGEQPYTLDFEWQPGCQCQNCFNCFEEDESYTLCELSDKDGVIITDLGMLQAAQEYLSSPTGIREAAAAMPGPAYWDLTMWRIERDRDYAQ